MYTSPLFKGSLSYAESLSKREDIYILSARYGLLKLNDIIDPYELTLNNQTESYKKRWAYKVYKQLESINFDFNSEVTFLCGLNYRKYLITKMPNAIAPLKGLGMGEQLQFYKKRNLI